MDVRKIIKEEIRKIFNEDYDYADEEIMYHDKEKNKGIINGIVGDDVLKYFPFSELPNTREEVDWDNRGVDGWGEIKIPSIDNYDSLTTIFSKEDLVGNTFIRSRPAWTNPSMRKQKEKVVDKGYLENFKLANGEEPIFNINKENKTVEIINYDFVKKVNDYISNKHDYLGEEKTLNNIVDKKIMDTPEGTLFVMNMAENESKKNNKRRNW